MYIVTSVIPEEARTTRGNYKGIIQQLSGNHNKGDYHGIIRTIIRKMKGINVRIGANFVTCNKIQSNENSISRQ
jgi:anthranilate/para-aminobenzoate synthase component I